MNKKSVWLSLIASIVALGATAQADNCPQMPISGKVYQLVNEGSGLAMDVGGASTDNGANILQWSSHSNANQQYKVTDMGDGYWSIRPQHSNHSIDLYGWSNEDGGSIKQWEYWGGATQQWKLTQSNSGAIKIASAHSGKLVSVGDSNRGSDIYQKSDSNSNYQHWFFNPIDGTCTTAPSMTLEGSAGDGEVSLKWNSIEGISGIQVYADTDSNPKGRSRKAVLGSDETQYTLTGLSNGTPYWFWIKYKSANGTWHNSNAFNATPKGASSGNDTPTTDPSGTVVSDKTALLNAIASAKAGDTIYVRGGTYNFSDTIEMTQSGSSSKKITLSKYPSDSKRPLFNFSSMSEKSSNRGMELTGNYWYIYGIDVAKAGDNGLYISGSNNTVEFSTFTECSDSGVQLGKGASNNLIKNVDSYNNADSSLENADGFAAKLDVGSGNKFYGCRAWNNLDDGYDGYLRGANNVNTTYENCWAIRNGYLKNGSQGSGDGNGFKTGGSDGKDLKHNATYINTIAAGNVHDGYDHNSNRGTVTIKNAIAHNNGKNINFSSKNQAQKLIIKNTISYGASDSLKASSTDISHNSWQNGHSADSGDFQSINIDDLLAARKSDGSLPDVKYFHLNKGSDLINAGTNVGTSYSGSAPDIGAFESAY